MPSSDCGGAAASVFEQPGGGSLGFWAGMSAGGEGVLWARWLVRGAKKSYRIGEDSVEIF
jgi:hypothetical protein